MELRFIKYKKQTSDAFSLYFEKPPSFQYSPGQYITMYSTLKKHDDRGAKRWFTLSSSPTEPFLTITTRHVKIQPSSFKDWLFDLKKSDKIKVDGPEGDFTLPADNKPIVWIAGGIGITPFRSQIKYLLDSNVDRKIHLIYSNRTPSDICFIEELNQAEQKLKQFSLEMTLTDRVPDDWTGKRGLITDQMIRATTDQIDRTHFYISGPEPMVESIGLRLKSLGVTKNLIHQDWFPGYSEKF